jgi:RNA polymerase sigma factor (sigma-70 family)
MDKAMMAAAEKTVLMYARKYNARRGADLGFDDLVQLGWEAVVKTLPAFKEGRGATFATFCRLPVETAIKNACQKQNPRLSLDAPIEAGEGPETFAEFKRSEGPGADELLAHAEREAKVRAIVARVAKEFRGREKVVKALVERLMNGEVVEERFRSEVSLADIAADVGVSRQAIGKLEQTLKLRLAEELEDLFEEAA